jgi:4-amino-4-deoxy-L-arabinose transferase-like glycosyltransferase
MWKFEKLAAPAAVAEPVSTVVAPAPVVMPPVLPPVLPVVVPPPVATRLVAPERRRKELTTEELPAARATWPTFVIVAGVAFVAIVAVIALSRAGHDDREDAAAPAPAGAAQLLATSFATHYDAVDRDLQALRKRLGASATSVVWARFGAIHVDAANATPEARSQADAELDAIQREMASLRGQ